MDEEQVKKIDKEGERIALKLLTTIEQHDAEHKISALINALGKVLAAKATSRPGLLLMAKPSSDLVLLTAMMEYDKKGD